MSNIETIDTIVSIPTYIDAYESCIKKLYHVSTNLENFSRVRDVPNLCTIMSLFVNIHLNMEIMLDDIEEFNDMEYFENVHLIVQLIEATDMNLNLLSTILQQTFTTDVEVIQVPMIITVHETLDSKYQFHLPLKECHECIINEQSRIKDRFIQIEKQPHTVTSPESKVMIMKKSTWCGTSKVAPVTLFCLLCTFIVYYWLNLFTY